MNHMNHNLYRLCIGVLLFCAGCSAMAVDAKPKDATSFSGHLTIYTVDNFKDRVSHTRYVLEIEESGKSVSLHFTEQTNVSELRTGMQLEVLGRQQNGYIDVDRFHIINAPSK